MEESLPAADTPGCCGNVAGDYREAARRIGYTDAELAALPEGANLGLGCGNPTAFASLKEGETVLDLGSGAGFDVFIAAARVGPKGRVIGVDMTPEMLELARLNALKSGYRNVEFRMGEIENLPVADNAVDCVISNCVINLSPDKNRVFTEAFRVLRPGGRLMVSDLVLLKPLSAKIRKSVQAYIGCVAGAASREDYLSAIRGAGFTEVTVVEETKYGVKYLCDDEATRQKAASLHITEKDLVELGEAVSSIRVRGVKA
jgi:arsenite methyltransferase